MVTGPVSRLTVASIGAACRIQYRCFGTANAKTSLVKTGGYAVFLFALVGWACTSAPGRR